MSKEKPEETRSPPSYSPPLIEPEAMLTGSEDEAAADIQSPSTPTAATNLSESEPMITEEDSAAHPSAGKISSVWYTHAKKYPGIYFSNYYTRQTVTYRGDTIKGEGIELQIPGHAIKQGESVEFTIQGCIDGPFELPKDVSLASPVFVITPHYQFEREVTLWEDIYIHLQSYEDCKEVVFLTSPSKPTRDGDGPHWNFQISENKPQCSVRSRRVRIQVKQFCLFCFGIRRRVPQYQYRVSLYSPLTSIGNMCRAVFSVSLYHEVFIKNLRVYLGTFRYGFHEICDTPQHLTEEEIKLCLPKATDTRYQIHADRKPCIILKSAVDIPSLSWRHKRRAIKDKGGYPPRITLTVTHELWQPIVCELGIIGVSDTLKAFNMTIPPNYYRGDHTLPGHNKGSIIRGHPGDDLTMMNLLHSTLSTSQTFVNIPKEIGGRSTELRLALYRRTLFQSSTMVLPHHSRLDDPRSDEHYNYSILQDWINSRRCLVSWASLADTLRDIGHMHVNPDLINSLRTYSASSPPTMSALVHFPVTKVIAANIPRDVGVKYLEFGTHLLQDVTGAHIHALEHQLNRDGERINHRILEEWLSGGGRPVTWATLVEVLNIIGMGELAKKIEDRYVIDTTAAVHTT